MNENKILAAILTNTTSARESRGSSAEVGKESWRKAIKDYQQILTELEPHDVYHASLLSHSACGKQLCILLKSQTDRILANNNLN